MKLDKICRTCLFEKANLKSLFDACVPSMIMSFVSVQIMQGDGLPHQICTQCLTTVNKAYTFKQQCEKSDVTLRNYLNINFNTNVHPIQLTSEPYESNVIDIHHGNIDNNVINDVRNDLFGNNEVLQQSSFLQEIFSDPTSHSLVENFTNTQANTVVSDLAETMQSLQTIAEQCLPDSWENYNQICEMKTEEVSNNFNLVDNLYKCQFCEDIFKDAWSLDEHTKNQNCQEKYFSTNITNELTKSMLLEYTFDTNSKDTFMLENIEPANQNLVCYICDRTFTDQKYLKKHLRDIHLDTTYTQEEKKHACTICGKKYRQHKVLVLHMRTHTGERPLKCEICSRTFALPSSLQKHKKIHRERQYECTICGQKFNQRSNLNGHILIHSGEKTHMCTTCGKRFSTNTNLEIHRRIHTGAKPFVCTFCDKAFISSTQMKKHMMVHTGEKPYSCWQCGRSFRRKETRDTHVRYHTGERPYSCRICDKKYIAASHLRVHMNSHSDDRKFQCMFCTKKFLDKRTLKSHILSHTGHKPFSCRFCGKSYVQSGGLSTHIKSCHNQ